MKATNFMIIVIVVFAVCGITVAAPDANPLIYAPEISAITVDGDLTDWAETSDWAVFGPWFEKGVSDSKHISATTTGLASTTMARYAWNDATNMFYIGIESTEGAGLILEIGGLMGDVSDANATPLNDPQATQIEFKNWSGGTAGAITNQLSGITTGVTAAYTLDGPNMVTIEIALPIYGDWANSGTAMDLQSQMDVYVYANVYDCNVTLGDSQVAAGGYVKLFDARVMDKASLVRLLETSEPQSCQDIPDVVKGPYDADCDCNVNFADFAALVTRWQQCNNPGDPDCQ